MDRLTAAGLSWKLYVATKGQEGYGWAICPTFADCLYTSEVRNEVANSQFVTDAESGNLPAFSILTPQTTYSQHNDYSMALGDDYIGNLVRAVMNGPDWSSTVIFIAYDDCGCFYDHVTPPPGFGIRVPMVIVSPLAKAAYTDSNVASYNSILAFTEHNFGLAPLTTADADAYDYSESFAQAGGLVDHAAFHLVQRQIPPSERRWIAEHPDAQDDDT